MRVLIIFMLFDRYWSVSKSMRRSGDLGTCNCCRQS